MKHEKPKKKHHVLRVIVILLILLLAAGVVLYQTVWKKAEDKALSAVTEEIVGQQGETLDSQDPAAASTAQKILSSMSESDKNRIMKIILKNTSASDRLKLLKYYRNGDTEALKNYALNNLSDEDLKTIYQIYGKY